MAAFSCWISEQLKGNGIFQPFPASFTFDSIHYNTGGYCHSMSFTALPKEIFQIPGARDRGACIHSGHPAPEPPRFPASFYKSGTAFPESADTAGFARP